VLFLDGKLVASGMGVEFEECLYARDQNSKFKPSARDPEAYVCYFIEFICDTVLTNQLFDTIKIEGEKLCYVGETSFKLNSSNIGQRVKSDLSLTSFDYNCTLDCTR
jgi:hypothetical protein